MIKIGLPVLEDLGEKSVICEHFGHAPNFAFAYVEGKEVVKYEVMKNHLENHQPGDIPRLMNDNDVNVMIVRGMGAKAIEFFNSFNIQVFKGAQGTAEELVKAYIDNTIEDKDYECNHSH